MTDSSWKPDGHEIRIQGVVLEWPQALRNFVLPIRHRNGWIEDSRSITSTGLSAREWFGLILHSIAMSDINDSVVLVSTENTGGDGAIVRYENGKGMAVLVEQTLATHRESGEIIEVIKNRIDAKSSRGENYADNKNLVVLCNNNGDLVEAELLEVVKTGKFEVVNIIGFSISGQGRHFLSYMFIKESSEIKVHRMAIDEAKMWQAAIDIYNSEQGKINNT